MRTKRSEYLCSNSPCARVQLDKQGLFAWLRTAGVLGDCPFDTFNTSEDMVLVQLLATLRIPPQFVGLRSLLQQLLHWRKSTQWRLCPFMHTDAVTMVVQKRRSRSKNELARAQVCFSRTMSGIVLVTIPFIDLLSI